MVSESENKDLSELKRETLQFAIDKQKSIHLQKIEEQLALLEEHKSVMQKIDGFEQFVKNQTQNLQNKKEFVEAQF